ncbi:MAG: ABC transporter substrate-binding protein [Acetobacter cibinongensis]
MSTHGPSTSPPSRRTVLLSSLAGLAVAGGLGAYQVLRHPRPPRRQPDGQYRQIKLAWPDASSAPVLAVAYQKDFFTQYSLDVDITSAPLNGSGALAALADGVADFAVAPALSWLPKLHDGLAANLILGIQPGVFRLLVRRGAGITRLDQLLGRTIAIPDQNIADKLFFAIMMRRKGINAMEGITWRPMPAGDMITAAAAKTIDAIATHDPFAWQLLGTSNGLFTELVSSNTGHYADRTNMILGVSSSKLAADPDAATAMTLALRDAARWANAHRTEAATLIAEATAGMNSTSVQDMISSEPPIHPVTGHPLREQIAQYYDELQLIGLLPSEESAADMARRYTRNVLRG